MCIVNLDFDLQWIWREGNSRPWRLVQVFLLQNVIFPRQLLSPLLLIILYLFKQTMVILAVFVLRRLWIVNYSVKSLSNNLSNENIKDKTWIKMPKWTIFELWLLWKHQCMFSCTEIIWHVNWRSIIGFFWIFMMDAFDVNHDS